MNLYIFVGLRGRRLCSCLVWIRSLLPCQGVSAPERHWGCTNARDHCKLLPAFIYIYPNAETGGGCGAGFCSPHCAVQSDGRAGEQGCAVGRLRIRPFLLSAVIIIAPKQINPPSPSLTKDAFPWPPLPIPAFPPHMHLAY